MEYKQIIEDLSKKIFYPIYVLYGEEPYYIDLIADYIADNVLTEDEKSFNQSIFYGKESDVHMISQMAKRFPMMSNYQVIIVKEAQELKNIKDFHHYAENPLKSTILVICHKYDKLDRDATGFIKLAKKHGVVFESPKIPEYKIGDFIKNYVKEQDYSIDDDSSILLGEYLGSNLHKVVNELQKLMIVLPKGSKITKLDIEKNIGISNEYNIFELQNAFAKKNVEKVQKILQVFASNPKANPSQLVFNSLFVYFRKLLLLYFIPNKSYEAVAETLQLPLKNFVIQQYMQAQKLYSAEKLVQIISLIREYELKSKGVNSPAIDEGELYRELAFKILH